MRQPRGAWRVACTGSDGSILPAVKDPLGFRPRVRRATTTLRRAVGRRRSDPPPAGSPKPVTHAFDLRDRAVPVEPIRPRRLATELAARLTDVQRNEVRRRVAALGGIPGLASEDNTHYTFQVCAAALHLGVPGVEETTGLRAAMPPPEIHAMDHTPLAAGGDVYTADLLDDAFAMAGAPLRPGSSVLDFGCSSGRVVRVMAAARPDVRFIGCDPNGPAVAWATDHLPEISFHESSTEPPLAFLEDETLDAAFAISIWSHFDAAPALAWLAEMHRVLRPGGHLLLTTHGWQSVAQHAQWITDVAHVSPTAQALYREGFAFYSVFDEQTGDWGVRASGWGMAFLTPEWLVRHATPAWAPRLLWPGANAQNQDVWVLERR
jgi:SAM-dependent methyltransferase